MAKRKIHPALIRHKKMHFNQGLPLPQRKNLLNPAFLKKVPERFIASKFQNHSIYRIENQIFILLKNLVGQPFLCLEKAITLFEFNSPILKNGVPILKDFEKYGTDFEGFATLFERILKSPDARLPVLCVSRHGASCGQSPKTYLRFTQKVEYIL